MSSHFFFCFLVNSVVKVQLTAAKPPAERSEANKVSFYLCFLKKGNNCFLLTAAKPPAERSEANKFGGEAAGRAKRGY